MSDTMLHGVLCMPPELWQDTELDRLQRYHRYLEASERIEHDALAITVLPAEVERARAQRDHLVKILSGIHMLLYPTRMTDSEGRTWEFRSPMVHEQIQELSDRIRAIPDEIAKAQALTPNCEVTRGAGEAEEGSGRTTSR